MALNEVIRNANLLGHQARGLPNDLVKIEGEAPMTLGEAENWLKENAAYLRGQGRREGFMVSI